MNKNKFGFTLAEVLITLAIIGVVAAITIPGLVTKINDKVSQRQIQIAEKRLAEGVRLYSQLDSGFNGRTYTDTYDFLKNGLSKHFKMTSICDAEHIADCWPGGKINYQIDDKLYEVDVSTLDSPSKMYLKNDDYYAPASFISGAGIPYIMLLKKNCVIDPDSRIDDNDIMACLDGFYDYSGTRTPNKLGTDVRSLNNAKLTNCIHKLGGVCIPVKQFKTTSPQMRSFADSNCEALQRGEEVIDTNGVFGTKGAKIKVTNSFKNCISHKDNFWLASKLKCEIMGYRLPTEKELAKIAAEIYGYTGNVTGSWSYSGSRGDIKKYGFTYLDSNMFQLWSGAEFQGQDYGPARSFSPMETTRVCRNLYDGSVSAVCVDGN